DKTFAWFIEPILHKRRSILWQLPLDRRGVPNKFSDLLRAGKSVLTKLAWNMRRVEKLFPHRLQSHSDMIIRNTMYSVIVHPIHVARVCSVLNQLRRACNGLACATPIPLVRAPYSEKCRHWPRRF